jgi:hypothetical protein
MPCVDALKPVEKVSAAVEVSQALLDDDLDEVFVASRFDYTIPLGLTTNISRKTSLETYWSDWLKTGGLVVLVKA